MDDLRFELDDDSTMGGSAEPTADADGLDRLRQQLQETEQRLLRLRADFENVRRRAAREHEAARTDGKRDALLIILPVIDALEHAIAAGSSDPDFYEGVVATHALFMNALRQAGAEQIEAVGKPFDPKVHEAVSTVHTDGVPPGTVVREVRRGWNLGNELLRPAQVVVATGSEAIGPSH